MCSETIFDTLFMHHVSMPPSPFHVFHGNSDYYYDLHLESLTTYHAIAFMYDSINPVLFGILLPSLKLELGPQLVSLFSLPPRLK